MSGFSKKPQLRSVFIRAIYQSNVPAFFFQQPAEISAKCLVLYIISIAILYTFRTKTLKRNPRLVIPVNAAVVTLAFGLALPFAIALFPQRSKVNVC